MQRPRLRVSATAGKETTVELAQVRRIAVCRPSALEGGQRRECYEGRDLVLLAAAVFAALPERPHAASAKGYIYNTNQERSVAKTKPKTAKPTGKVKEAQGIPYKPKETKQLQPEQRRPTKDDKRDARREWGEAKECLPRRPACGPPVVVRSRTHLRPLRS